MNAPAHLARPRHDALATLAGAGSLVRLILRRDRIRLPVWVLALFAITYVSADAVGGVYDTQQKIDSYALNIGNSPATIAMAGPPVGLHTIQGIVVYETSLTVLIGVALMVVFTVVRHTRAEEEAGRTELLSSAVVGRHAGTVAAVMVAVLAAVLVGLSVVVSVLPQGFPAEAAWLYGAAVSALGLVFAAVAAVAAQLVSHARSATGLGIAVLGVGFAVRAAGDVRGSALSWFSPIGWSQQVRVAGVERWWPLLLSAVVAVMLLALAGWLTTRRDFGSGVLPARPGSPVADRTLGSPLGLAWRLQRGSIVAWSSGLFMFGLLFGSLSRELQNMVQDNPLLQEYFKATGGSVTDSLFATSMLLTAIMTAGFAVGSVLRIRGEEEAGRLESMLATRVSRARVLLAPLLVTVGGSVLLVTSGGLGLGIADSVVSRDASSVLRLTALSWVQLPGVLVLAGVAVLLTGWLPRWVAVAWAGVAVSFVIGWLGGLLDPPGWVSALSPFEHLPLVPVENLSGGPLVALAVLAAVLTGVGLIGFQRRDIG